VTTPISAGFEVTAISLAVIYVVILVLGVRAVVETYRENRAFSKLCLEVASIIDKTIGLPRLWLNQNNRSSKTPITPKLTVNH